MDTFSSKSMLIARIKSILRKRRIILEKEGFASLLKNLFLTFLNFLFSYEHFYLYEYKLDPSLSVPNVPCKVDNLVMKPIFIPITLQEYEMLGSEGFDFSTHPEAQEFKEGLCNGTIVFYTFSNNELVNRTGMTLYRNGVYRYVYPAHMDDSKTVYAGFSETNKNYRKKGIYTYVHSEIYKYLRENGFSKVILLEAEALVGIRKIQNRLGSEVLYESYHLKLLFFLDFRWNRPKIGEHRLH